ncbi:hypothetical protein NPIL_108911 [Nephila pilipes]|uniref:Uncharacterized protein n=1 Tax=Nephila pilipes TaxID=299642 RepID=A0A8X6MQ44_NEPPI|nr:hypothetical protein NPIL_108911 [Nephila pilipes]
MLSNDTPIPNATQNLYAGNKKHVEDEESDLEKGKINFKAKQGILHQTEGSAKEPLKNTCHNFTTHVVLGLGGQLRYNFESGWLEQKMIDEFSGYTECLTEGNAEVQSLQLEHTLGTFLILVMGCTVSIIVLLAEMYWKYFKKNVPSDAQNKWTNDKKAVINSTHYSSVKLSKFGGMLDFLSNKF